MQSIYSAPSHRSCAHNIIPEGFFFQDYVNILSKSFNKVA